MFRSHVESRDADQEVIDAHLSSLQNVLSSYSRRDIFNANKCSSQYQMSLDIVIATYALPRYRKQKKSCPVLVCCSADESQKFELLFTGHEKPSPLLKTYWKDYDRNYYYKKKA